MKSSGSFPAPPTLHRTLEESGCGGPCRCCVHRRRAQWPNPVTARTNHLAEIETLLGVIQAPTATPEPRETRVLNLAERQATELAGTVRSLYEDSLKTKPIPPSEQAVIRVDTEGNRLIVTGRTNDLEHIATLVLNLDTANQRSGNSRIFRLTNAEPAQVAAALSNTLAKLDPSGRLTPA